MPLDLTASAHETASGTDALERLLVRREDFRVGILLRFWIGSTLFGGLPSAHVTLRCIVYLNRNSLSIISNGCTFTIGTTFVNITPTIAGTPFTLPMESRLPADITNSGSVPDQKTAKIHTRGRSVWGEPISVGFPRPACG